MWEELMASMAGAALVAGPGGAVAWLAFWPWSFFVLGARR